MLGSFTLGRVLGIPVRVHWLLAALVLVLSALSPHPLSTLGALTILFAVVGLHELGHSVVAQRYGARVFDITFWPLGGMARMSEIPEDPGAETAIALAGPAVNFVLAVIALAALGLMALVLPPVGLDVIVDPSSWPDASFGSALAFRAVAGLEWFLAINVVLGTFNLVPAFPMDGGRVLRAQLARRMGFLPATEAAVKVGRAIAVVMIVVGLVIGHFVLIAVAVFVWLAGARELLAARMRRAPMGGSFFDLFRAAAARAAGAPPGAGSAWVEADVVDPTADPPVPPAPGTSGAPGARRPSGPWASEAFGDGPWTEERIRLLERFRGRLPRHDA